jgi:hypothetical protein
VSLLNPAARELIESGKLAHLVTLAPDGSPRVAIIWVGLDGDEIVAGHLDRRQIKLRNIAATPASLCRSSPRPSTRWACRSTW